MHQPKIKILIIDDDERNIFALSAVLKARQYDCITATSGKAGLEILKQQPSINLALVDMMMPEMDGYELIEHIRDDKKLRHLQLVAVTAQAMYGDRQKCLAAGADAYISKPVDIDKLMIVINDLSHHKKPLHHDE